MYLHQYDYIFAIGTLFAMLDAYNNGASKSTNLSDTGLDTDPLKMMLPILGLLVFPLGPSPTARPWSSVPSSSF